MTGDQREAFVAMCESFGDVIASRFDTWGDDSDAQDAVLDLADRLVFLVEGRPDFAMWERELSE